MRALLLLLLIPIAAVAQLQLYVAPPNSEILLGGSYDQGSVAAGDILETRFRVRNNGRSPATVTSVSVGGAGFSMPTPASLPYVLAAGLNYDFVVRFQARDQGTYSANLAVNGISVLLRATALAAAVVRANGNPVNAGSNIDFGRVERAAWARSCLNWRTLRVKRWPFDRFNSAGRRSVRTIFPCPLTSPAARHSCLRFDSSQKPPACSRVRSWSTAANSGSPARRQSRRSHVLQ